MSSYVSYGPYSLGPNLTYGEKIELVERMCKIGVWSKDVCIKYIEELEKEKQFLKTSMKNAQSISNAIGKTSVSAKLEGNLDKARREEERRMDSTSAEEKYWEGELEKEFAKLEAENSKGCKKDKDGKCTIMGGRYRTRKANKKMLKVSRKSRQSRKKGRNKRSVIRR
jgi:hypothetical protein